MRQRLDLGRADRQVGIEEVGEPDAIGLGHQAQGATIGVERVAATGVDGSKAVSSPR